MCKHPKVGAVQWRGGCGGSSPRECSRRRQDQRGMRGMAEEGPLRTGLIGPAPLGRPHGLTGRLLAGPGVTEHIPAEGTGPAAALHGLPIPVTWGDARLTPTRMANTPLPSPATWCREKMSIVPSPAPSSQNTVPCSSCVPRTNTPGACTHIPPILNAAGNLSSCSREERKGLATCWVAPCWSPVCASLLGG